MNNDQQQPINKPEAAEGMPDAANPNHIENPDDLHEIRVNDDLGEPDAEATGLIDEEAQPEGDANQAANPTELNS